MAFASCALLYHTKRSQISNRKLVCATASGNDNQKSDSDVKVPYSLRARLKEETEAPFRKVRMFVWFGSAASAAVGAFIAASRIAAGFAGVQGVQPLSETIPNVFIDLGVIAACLAALRFEQKSGEKRLERISRGARLAALRISGGGVRGVRPFSSLRKERRIVIVGGKAGTVLSALYSAYERRENFDNSALSILPLFDDLDGVQERGLELPPEGAYRLEAYDRAAWREWLDIERKAARRFLGDAVDDCIVVVIRKDGKVGARAAGSPDFDRLLDEVAKLPTKDRYGKP